MNIHLKEESLFQKLLDASRVEILVGSHLYGMTNKSSDKDFLNIMGEFEDNKNSLIWTHNQFQWKDKNTDYLFTSLSQFLRNILTGDSTINFESLFSEEINNGTLSFLDNYKNEFISYNLIRSYQGLAKRDIKFYKRENESKRLFHIVRGVDTAEHLMKERYYSNDLSFLKSYDLLKSLKSESLDLSTQKQILSQYEQKNESLRLELKKMYESDQIGRGMNLQSLMMLDQEVIEWNKLNSIQGSFLLDSTYESLFKDINYTNE